MGGYCQTSVFWEYFQSLFLCATRLPCNCQLKLQCWITELGLQRICLSEPQPQGSARPVGQERRQQGWGAALRGFGVFMVAPWLNTPLPGQEGGHGITEAGKALIESKLCLVSTLSPRPGLPWTRPEVETPPGWSFREGRSEGRGQGKGRGCSLPAPGLRLRG